MHPVVDSQGDPDRLLHIVQISSYVLLCWKQPLYLFAHSMKTSLATIHRTLQQVTYMAALSCLALLSVEGSPIKVFVLVGQSNMQGHAHERTLGALLEDPLTAPILGKVRDAQGAAIRLDRVWVSSLSSGGLLKGSLRIGFGASDEKIGPELGFGVRMSEALNQPIVLIKAAWGGKSLHTDFRPPGSGPYRFNETQIQQLKKQGKDVEEAQSIRSEASGVFYRQFMDHVHQSMNLIKEESPFGADKEYTLSGLIWFQGWNDMVDRGVYPQRGQPGGYDDYSRLLEQWIRDVRQDLNAPLLPIVIGVMGAGGPVALYREDQQRYSAIHQSFRDAMAAPAQLASFKSTVKAVLTENCWDMELTELRYRERFMNQEIQARLKSDDARQLGKDEKDALRLEIRQKNFSQEEWDTLQSGVSNAEYHYLGSAKIMVRIGISFAQAMLSML